MILTTLIDDILVKSRVATSNLLMRLMYRSASLKSLSSLLASLPIPQHTAMQETLVSTGYGNQASKPYFKIGRFYDIKKNKETDVLRYDDFRSSF